MKGLAKKSPVTALVKVDSRLARKHYGLYHSLKYNKKLHRSREDDKLEAFQTTNHG